MDAPLVTAAVASSSYQTTPEWNAGFEPDQVCFVVSSSDAADIVYISFDGFEDHGILVPGTIQSLVFNEKRKRAWLRLSSGTGPVTVYVMGGTVV